MKTNEFLANVQAALLWLIPKGLKIPGGKVAEGVSRIGGRLAQLIQSPAIALEVLLVLRMYGLQLTI